MKTVTDEIPKIIEETEDELQSRVQNFIQKPGYETAAKVFRTFKVLCNHHGMSMFRVELAAVSKRKHRKKSEAQ